jgi:hypothetical protein
MFRDWFNSLVAAAVLILLIVAGGSACRGDSFDPISLAVEVWALLTLPILRKLASRNPRRKR